MVCVYTHTHTHSHTHTLTHTHTHTHTNTGILLSYKNNKIFAICDSKDVLMGILLSEISQKEKDKYDFTHVEQKAKRCTNKTKQKQR